MSGIIAPDNVTEEYARQRNSKPFESFKSDADADYFKEYSYNVNSLEPGAAKPHSPDNFETVRKITGTKITKGYIGSCTGGKMADFTVAAKILNGKEVKVPTYIVPASPSIAKQLKTVQHGNKTIEDVLLSSGCIITPSSCAACLGGPADTVGRSIDHDVVISTTNRNFPGRMGSKRAEVYLASPLTVAASAVNGVITDPRDEL